MATVIDLANIYFNVFGILGNQYPKDTLQKSYNNQSGNYPTELSVISQRELTIYGTPFFQRTKINGVYLPNEPLVSITGSKNIVRTQLDGRDGTFKENMSLDDYKIVIRGICVNEDDPDEYPEDQVRSIRQMYEEKESVTIVNDLLTLFGIDLVAIETIEFDAVAGSGGMQSYVIQLLSDKEFDLELKNN